MGKKGKGGGKKKQVKEDKEVLPEVDKEFYEIQITDLNQKLARLRSHCAELELENDDVRKNLQKLDEDRADIIAYLKRNLQAKADEIAELQERLIALQQAREAENNAFQEKIKTMEHEFKSMHEQLNSEIKLLYGKLNSLEEFRREREDLMKKFLKQEEDIEEQEKIHKKSLYEVERKFIIGKDELKKEVENKLLQLSLDFQNTTDIRIATTTHRVIRENIAINNEIKTLMESWKSLHDENADLRKKIKELKCESELQSEDIRKLSQKNFVQNKIIDKITEAHSEMKESYKELTALLAHNQKLQQEVDSLTDHLYEALAEVQREQDVLAAQNASNLKVQAECQDLKNYCQALQHTLSAAAEAVSRTLKVQEEPEEDEAYNISEREALVSTLLQLFDNVEIRNCDVEPTIKGCGYSSAAISISYTNGDLGLIPKSVISTRSDMKETNEPTDMITQSHSFNNTSS